jgi:heme-degrading monooxygenase HmoA
MILRMWRGRAAADNAQAYIDHATRTVFPKLKLLAGFQGGGLLRRESGGLIEYLVVTHWESWNAVRAFAGERPDIAVVEPEAKAALVSFDEGVEHFEEVLFSTALGT